MITFIMKHIISRAIFPFFMLNLFVASTYISPSVAREQFFDREGAKARKHKI